MLIGVQAAISPSIGMCSAIYSRSSNAIDDLLTAAHEPDILIVGPHFVIHESFELVWEICRRNRCVHTILINQMACERMVLCDAVFVGVSALVPTQHSAKDLQNVLVEVAKSKRMFPDDVIADARYLPALTPMGRIKLVKEATENSCGSPLFAEVQ
jgi:DNA-binding NarL/FixJ family response regulator